MSNVLAGIGGIFSGLLGGIESERRYRQTQQQLDILKAAAGIRDGSAPTGASLTPDATAADAPPLPSSLEQGADTSSLPSMTPQNPIATNSPLLSPTTPGNGIGPASGGASPSSGGLNGIGLPSAPGGIAQTATPPSVLTPPNLTGGRPDMMGILRAAAAANGSTGAPDPDSPSRNYPGLQTVRDALYTPDASGAPTTGAGVFQALRAANDAQPAPLPPAVGNNFAPPGSGAAAFAAAAALGPRSAVSDADVANARGAINGQIAFNNPAVRNPLTGQMDPRYQNIGHGMYQDILSDDFSQRARLEQLGTDRALSMWGLRNEGMQDRTNTQVTGRLTGIGMQQTGAGQRTDATIAARSGDVQARIDAADQRAADNRAAGMKKFLAARTPSDQQRAQLTLGAYDKLRLQSKDPITGEYSADPDTLWQNAQDLVGRALGPSGGSGAGGSSGRSASGSGGAASSPVSSGGLTPTQATAVAQENARATAALQSIDPKDPQAGAKHRAIAATLNQRIQQLLPAGQ